MEKALCWVSMVTAGILFIVFLLDAILDIPFYSGVPARPFTLRLVDIIIALACVLVLYLSWSAFRDLRR